MTEKKTLVESLRSKHSGASQASLPPLFRQCQVRKRTELLTGQRASGLEDVHGKYLPLSAVGMATLQREGAMSPSISYCPHCPFRRGDLGSGTYLSNRGQSFPKRQQVTAGGRGGDGGSARGIVLQPAYSTACRGQLRFVQTLPRPPVE